MPRLDGIDATRQLLELQPALRPEAAGATRLRHNRY
jgi:hypothetical protein